VQEKRTGCFVLLGGGQVVNQEFTKDLSNYTNPKATVHFTIGGAGNPEMTDSPTGCAYYDGTVRLLWPSFPPPLPSLSLSPPSSFCLLCFRLKLAGGGGGRSSLSF
jgi:hypothetical protein